MSLLYYIRRIALVLLISTLMSFTISIYQGIKPNTMVDANGDILHADSDGLCSLMLTYTTKGNKTYSKTHKVKCDVQVPTTVTICYSTWIPSNIGELPCEANAYISILFLNIAGCMYIVAEMLLLVALVIEEIQSRQKKKEENGITSYTAFIDNYDDSLSLGLNMHSQDCVVVVNP